MPNEFDEMPQSPEIGKTKYWVTDYGKAATATVHTGIVEAIEEESEGYMIKVSEGVYFHVWQSIAADTKEDAILNWANHFYTLFAAKRDSLLAQ